MDSDYVMAMRLSDEWNYDVIDKDKENKERPLSVVDPTWELIDPVPDIRELFVEFNAAYFDQMLAGVEVKWSTRMTLCAGLCCYEGRGGLCSIKLSSPLLKLRPRKDLVETLLHEMIHALLFVTDNNKDHDGHGDEFHKHMYRINKKAGCNITVYHSFHDEVNSYRQHWWRCNGPCVKWPPYYGIVRRAMNRAPSQRDPWWNDHKRRCGGSYTKIKEPENYGKKVTKASDKKQSAKSNSLINNHTSNDNKRPILNFFNKNPQGGDSTSTKSKKGGGTISSTRTNSSSTVIIKSKNENKSRKETSTKVNTDSSSKKRSNVHGVDWNSDSGEQVYSASSNNASSNVHGFKMSARKNTDQKINTFKGSGFTLGGTTTKRATVIEKNSNSPDIAIKREMFLKRFQQNHSSIPQSQNKRLKIERSDSKETERKRDCETANKNEPVATLSLVSPKTSNNVEVIDLNDTAPDDDDDINYVQCPACPKLIKETELNDHLDKCLQ